MKFFSILRDFRPNLVCYILITYLDFCASSNQRGLLKSCPNFSHSINRDVYIAIRFLKLHREMLKRPSYEIDC